MKHLKWMIVCICLFLTGCTSLGGDYQMIERPIINRSPLQGRWVVTNIQVANNQTKDLQSIIGSDAVFAPNAAIFDTQRIVEPHYTVRKAKTDYLLKVGYNRTKEELGITNDNLFVITIYEKDRSLFTVYREKEDVAYIDVYGNLLRMVKTKLSLDDKQLDNLLKNSTPETLYYSEVPGN